MGLRTRLALMVVIGLLLIVASAAYVGVIPVQANAQAMGAGGGKLVMPPPGASCGAGESDGCALKEAGGGCSDGGSCAMEEPAREKAARKPEATGKQAQAKPATDKQPAKTDAEAVK